TGVGHPANPTATASRRAYVAPFRGLCQTVFALRHEAGGRAKIACSCSVLDESPPSRRTRRLLAGDPMALEKLELYTIRCVNMEQSRDFYRDVVNLKEGPRPPL